MNNRHPQGSAVNSTVRQLGVAVLGSVYGATQLVVKGASGQLPGHGAPILQAASDAFVRGMAARARSASLIRIS